jgi:hypothetical protein
LGNKRIKSPESKKDKINISANKDIDTDYPVFCFKHLVINCKGDHKFYFEFIERLQKLSTLSWKVINTSYRHGFGTEQIPINQIKPTLPMFITPDVTALIAFRANGDNRPFLGLRRNNVFHIVFIEEKFGDIYNH